MQQAQPQVQYITPEKECGPISVLLCLLGFWCVCCCPCDEKKMVMVGPGGQQMMQQPMMQQPGYTQQMWINSVWPSNQHTCCVNSQNIMFTFLVSKT